MSFFVFENEYIYKFKLEYRKTIPSNNAFYVFMFLIKFFPLILLTHAIDPEAPDDLFTLSKVIENLTFIGNITIKSYDVCCGIIYTIIIALLLAMSYLFFLFYSASKKTDYILYKIPINKLRLTDSTKTIMKYTIWLFLLVIFFYQHLVEILYFGIFRIYSGIIIDKNSEKVLPYSNQYIIGGLNILFTIILIFLMHLFIFVSSTKTIKCSFGFQLTNSFISNFVNILYFSTQGLYTTSYFYSQSTREHLLIIFCVVLVVLMGMDLLYNLNDTKNYLFESPVPLFIDFIKYSCFFSGILEIYAYYLVSYDQRISQKYYLLKFIIVPISGMLITWAVREIKRTFSLKKLSEDLFVSNNAKKKCDIENLLSFYIRLEKISLIQDKLILILKLIQEHQVKCVSKGCRCREIKGMYQMMEEKTIFEQILRKFIILGEKKIVNTIMNHSDGSYNLFGSLLFTHCDFLFSIKKKFHITLYLSQYYFTKKQRQLKFKYLYLLYEINYLAYHQKKKFQKKKYVSILKENLNNEKLQNIMLLLVTKIEQILTLKRLKNTNSKIVLKCEDFLDLIQTYASENNNLINLIEKFAKMVHFDHSTKIKFLIYYYIKLFNISLPKKVRLFLYSGQVPFPTYDSIYTSFIQNSKDSGQYIISYLNADDKFFIQYISSILAEKLHYQTNELINADINEVLIPKLISKYHRIYMKEYILLGYNSFKKKTFILNKKFQMYPIFIHCKVVPTISNLYGLVINVDPIKSSLYSRYDFILDMGFNILYISESFENQFFFTLKMLHSLKINFCEFFGISKDSLTNYFSSSVKGFTPPEKKERLPLASTSYKLDEIADFQTLNFENILKKNSEATREQVVGKEKVEAYLLKLGKTIDELGLEKEWKLLINVLYDKIKRKFLSGTATSIQEYKTKQPMIDNNFYINIEFKELGPVQYYISTINELIDESLNNSAEEKNRSKKYVGFGDELNVAIKNGNLDDLFMNLKQRQSKQFFSSSQLHSPVISPKKENSSRPGSNLNTTNENSMTINNSNANFLITGGENNLSRIASTITLEPKKDKSQAKQEEEDFIRDKLSTQKLNRLERKLNNIKFLRILQFLLGFGVLALNIANLLKNFYAIEYSLNIFKANAYSYFVLHDVLFGALCCLNSCFIQEGIQTGNDTYQAELINLAAVKLIEDYHQFNSHVTEVISDANLRPLYQTLNEEDEYVSLLSNWETRNYSSTLVDEIYLIHHSFKTFVTSNDPERSNCRIKQFFFFNNYEKYKGTLDPEYSSTIEERFTYYIMNNVLTTIVQRIEKDNIQLCNFFQKNNENSRTFFLYFNFIILVSACFLYFLMLWSIWKSRILFKGRFNQMLIDYDHEEIFFEDIKKFKSLIQNFNREKVNEYSNYKNCIHSTGFSRAMTKTNTKATFASRSSLVRVFKGKSKFSSTSSLKKIKKDQKGYNEPTYKTSTYKNKNKEEKLEEKDQEENMTKRTKIKKDPEFFLLAMIAFVLVFGAFIGVEIAIIITNTEFFRIFFVGHLLASNFLWIFPKLNELVLYAFTTAILDDPLYITMEASKYKDSVYCNYFNLVYDLEKNTDYSTFGESNFAYLYYQLYIIRQNTIIFSRKKDVVGCLKTTAENDKIFSTGLDLCVHSNYVYYSSMNEKYDYMYIFGEMSNYIRKCREVGNGINLSGITQTLNLMSQEVINLYKNFYNSQDKNRGLTLIQDGSFNLILDNLNRVLARLNSSYGRTILFDVGQYTSQDKKIKILLSVVSICLSCFFILGILWMILLKFDQYNNIIKKIIYIFNNFDKNLEF